jgi:hypothetical protein
MALFFIMLPLAMVGIVIHFPAYHLIGPLATRFAKDRDVVATSKIFAAATAFPLTWIVVAVVIDRTFDLEWSLLSLVAMPFTGYVALVFLERLDRVIGSTRALALLLLRPIAFQRLVAERRKIREAILQANADTAGGMV